VRVVQRLGALALAAGLLLAQQQLQIHALSHLRVAAGAAHALGATPEPAAEHDAGDCALCLAVAATASFVPAGAPMAALAMVSWAPTAGVAATGQPRPATITHFIRGPPAAATASG
jgi:hypothetical protein